MKDFGISDDKRLRNQGHRSHKVEFGAFSKRFIARYNERVNNQEISLVSEFSEEGVAVRQACSSPTENLFP